MRLWLHPSQAETIARHALDSRPNEACGLIAGNGEEVKAIIPIANMASHPNHEFRLDDHAFTQAMFGINRAGMELIGIYHSHPEGDPIPSHTDLANANYPDAVYVIVGLRHSEPRLAGWEIRPGTVTPVELSVGYDSPPAPERTLSNAQKIAIVTAAVTAFIFMLILSLSLLPPAPIIIP